MQHVCEILDIFLLLDRFLKDDVLCDIIALSQCAAFLWIVISLLFCYADDRHAYVAHDLSLCESEMHSGS